MTGLWNLKEIQNSRQNRSKYKLSVKTPWNERKEVAHSGLWGS